MPVHVYIPTPFRESTGGRSQIQLEADNVGDLLRQLAATYPNLRDRLLEQNGEIAEHLNIYVNQEEVRNLTGLDTPLSEGDEVALVPAIAGGSSGILNDEQLERYSRHVLLEEVGIEGQRKLLDSRVLLIGAGGLGSPAAIYLAAAGVGTLGIIDADRVDLTNLQRQILHFSNDVGRPKTESARHHIEALNPDVQVIEHRTLLTSSNALDILPDYDVIVNGCDNFPTRYLVNDACVMLGKPLVDASILKFEGQMTVFAPGKGCYRCLYPTPPPPGMVPSCAEGGIIGALAGHMGTLQAVETVKILLGIGEPLTNRLLIYDALSARYHILNWRRNPNCPACGENPTLTELIDYEQFCGMPLPRANDVDESKPEVAGRISPRPSRVATREEAAESPQRNSQRNTQGEPQPIDVPTLLRRKDPFVSVDEAASLLREDAVQLFDVREPHEFEQMRIKEAKLVPLGELADRVSEIDPERPALFLCTVGERSGAAVDALRRAGYQRVYNIKGGLMAWLNKQLPVESGKPEGAP